jgi:hypothetical protein
MNATVVDGVSAMFSSLTGSSEGLSMPSATTLLAAGSTAAIGYALWEQVKFRMYRAGKKEMLAGRQYAEEQAQGGG